MTGDKRQEIQQQAEQLLALPFASGIFPVPVEKLVEYLGFECHLFEPNATTNDISGVVNHKNKKIFISKNDPAQRQLFTVAHEVGHIVLHGDKEDYIDYRNNSNSYNPTGIKEVEANHFAACLLMPEQIFRFQWRKCHKDLNELSRFFGTSSAAIAVRAEALGLD